MSTIRVTGGVGDLVADLEKIHAEAPVLLRGVIRDGIKTGNSVAKDFARASAGAHGKHYPNAFTAEMSKTFSGFGSNVYQGTYGPDAARPQGDMSFEYGSRNQPPHLDLAKSADLIGPALPGEVRRVLDRLFW